MAEPLRIFLSSPGDVIPERRRAKLVIEKLSKTYARFFSIEAVLWEVEPMLASGHFQDQITAPSETDIVVLIVWSRLGTPLPQKTGTRAYHGIDGRAPVTGTEWEFEDALAAQKAKGAPDLLAYRKQIDPTVSLRNKAAKAAAEEQWEKLDGFWNRWFVNRGEFRAAFAEFSDLDTFEAKLESDLARLLERRIQTSQKPDGTAGAATPTWLAGSPFRGLETYRFEDASIFFGRSAVTRAAVEQLTENGDNGRAFLLILGASGAGKSSLAQAGVLPTLAGKGIVPRVGLWRRAILRPSGHLQGPFGALAQALVEGHALPELLTGNQTAEALARHLRAAADEPAFPIVAALNTLEDQARIRGDLLAVESAKLAIIVDQLEELFTQENSPDERRTFIRCLDGLAKSGRIYVLATMRSDYWHRAAETPLLVEMAANTGRLDLLPPAQDEIIEMIGRPAEAAGLTFEADPLRDIPLDATLASEAANQPGALPLLSFLLDELYKLDVAQGGRTTLTYAAMQTLGGLKGAIASRAESVFKALPERAQAAFPKVLRALVTVAGTGAAPTSRAVRLTLFASDPAARQLIDALLDPHARLLVAEGDGERVQLRIAHEALISHWQRARQQIEQDRDDLRTRNMIEQAHAEWRDAKPRDKRGLLLRDPQLANALDLGRRWAGELDPAAIAFVETSRRRARLSQQLTIAAAAVFALLTVFAGWQLMQTRTARLAEEQQRMAAEASGRRAEIAEKETRNRTARVLQSLAAQELRTLQPSSGAAFLEEGDSFDSSDTARRAVLKTIAAGLRPLSALLQSVSPDEPFSWNGGLYLRHASSGDVIRIGYFPANGWLAFGTLILITSDAGEFLIAERKNGKVLNSVRGAVGLRLKAAQVQEQRALVCLEGYRGSSAGTVYSKRYEVDTTAALAVNEQSGHCESNVLELRPVPELRFPSSGDEQELWASVQSDTVGREVVETYFRGASSVAVFGKPPARPKDDEDPAEDVFAGGPESIKHLDMPQLRALLWESPEATVLFGVRVWGMAGEERVLCGRSNDLKIGCTLFDVTYGMQEFKGVRFSSDGGLVVAFGRNFKVNERAGVNVALARGPLYTEWHVTESSEAIGAITDAAFSPDGKWVALLSSESVSVHNVDNLDDVRFSRPLSGGQSIGWVSDEAIVIVDDTSRLALITTTGAAPTWTGFALLQFFRDAGAMLRPTEWWVSTSHENVFLVGTGGWFVAMDSRLGAPITMPMRSEGESSSFDKPRIQQSSDGALVVKWYELTMTRKGLESATSLMERIGPTFVRQGKSLLDFIPPP